MELRNLCKRKREELRITHQAIADKSGIPIGTVNNFFSRSSTAPSVYTAGPICAVLGVSLDRYFGICPRKTGKELDLSHQVDAMEDHLSTSEHTIDMLHEGIRVRNRMICGLILLVAGLCLWCIYREVSPA